MDTSRKRLVPLTEWGFCAVRRPRRWVLADTPREHTRAFGPCRSGWVGPDGFADSALPTLLVWGSRFGSHGSVGLGSNARTSYSPLDLLPMPLTGLPSTGDSTESSPDLYRLGVGGGLLRADKGPQLPERSDGAR